ncbi:MAG TPA: histidinol dehydrogenase, partial [Desulfobacterales bacterium]|nr:histidinol dehydrogenase [Desulfobacterales bacterium]
MKIYQYPSKDAEKRVEKTIERGLGFSKQDQKMVELYLDDIKTRGDEALVEYTNKFDSKKVTIDSLKVTPKEFDVALKNVEASFLKTLDRSVNQLEYFHLKQKENS